MLAGKPDFAFAAANLRIPLLLVGVVNDECAALIWIADPRLCHYSFQVLAKARVNFIHVGDESLRPFCLVELIKPAGVIFITVRLQQAAFTGLSVGRVPYFKILIG